SRKPKRSSSPAAARTSLSSRATLRPAATGDSASNGAAHGSSSSPSRRVVRGARVTDDALIVSSTPARGGGRTGRANRDHAAPALAPDAGQILVLARRQVRRLVDAAAAQAARRRTAADR